MSLLAVLPALVALIVCLRRGPSYALIAVYLPVLLLLPDELRWPFSGHLTLSESAILPIAVFFIIKRGREWRWSLADFLVVALIVLTTISEGINRDAAHARNLALNLFCTTALPYMLAKGLFERELLGAAFAKRFAICATVVAIVSVYEFRMGVDLFERVIIPLFPGRSITAQLFRYAYARIQGPWTQPILAGILFAGAYRLTRWLEWSGNWPGRVPCLPISKTRFCEILIVLGSIMTVSRGPWVGAAAGGICVVLVRARRRLVALAVTLAVAIMIGGPVNSAFKSYASVDRLTAATDTQATAAYRYELLQKYVAIVEERPTWGWGSSLFPRVDNLDSIDNQYLLVALDQGIYTLAVFVGLLVWMIVRLLRFALFQQRGGGAMLLGVSLLGTIVMIAVSISTVWLGAQTQPLLYLVIGWSEGLLLANARAVHSTTIEREPVARRVAAFRFARVMV
ncbi:MAG TPA: O-antigen ligase family protein [Candidatus Binataceae bacterium]|nr:O-antigen ligase family protein [Candidatus Binataceae bacterium]